MEFSAALRHSSR